MQQRHYKQLLAAVFAGCFGVVSTCEATLVTIARMNADSDASSLEGVLGGSGVDGSSSFAITAGPSTTVVASTSAVYSVTGVDLDGDSVFDESFVFSITFSSPTGVNFDEFRETVGVGGPPPPPDASELFQVGETITLTFEIQSDSSPTHDVVVDGVSEVDFIGHSGTVLSVSSASGDADVTLAGVGTPLPGLFVDPTLFLNNVLTPDSELSNIGNLEDWSVQFSSISAIPEPTAFLFGGLVTCGLVTTHLRRRRPAYQS